MIAHEFNGTPFTVGIEEELMLVNPETLDLAQGIEEVLGDASVNGSGQVKPELMQSVLEIATDPCPDLPAAIEQLRELRHRVQEAASRHGMLVGAGGTHPTSDWRDQRITERERYKELVEQLSWIARQELLFGTHVHVGICDPDQAVYVSDALRRQLPVLLALSVNSPIWRGEATGMMSSRTPVFRQFPRIGIPPHYGDWKSYEKRVEMMMQFGAIPDYTYLWWDVRPHPNLGTVEVRIFDQQRDIEETAALTAFTLCLAARYARQYERGRELDAVPGELIDDSKIAAALRGLESEIIDLDEGRRRPAGEIAGDLVADLASEAQALGCSEQLAATMHFINEGTGARRQLRILDQEGIGGVVQAAILES